MNRQTPWHPRSDGPDGLREGVGAGRERVHHTSRRGYLAISATLCAVATAVALSAAGPTAADRASDHAGLDRSLDDPRVKRIQSDWNDAPEPKVRNHPPFNEIPAVERDLEKQRRDRAGRAALRKSPEAKDDRRRSRTAHASLRRSEALELARARFSRLFSRADRRLLPLQEGQRVLRYTGKTTAVVDSDRPGRASLVESTLPLRTRDDDGELQPIDLDLRRTTRGWEPSNGPVPLSFGERADEALSFPEDFTVALSTPDVTGTRASNEIFFSDIAADTDAWLGPVPTGARVAFQLRSEDSPEEVRLSIDDAPGLQLRVAPSKNGVGNGVELVKDGERVGAMSPPSAFDANGEPLDVTLRVDGRQIVIGVPHRGRDLLYPLAVDPVFENQDSWLYGNGNWAGWQYYESVPQFPHGNYHGCCGYGWWIARNPHQWFSNSWFAEYKYGSPNDFSYIHRADFMHVRHWAWDSKTTQGMWSIHWGGFQHHYTSDWSFDGTGTYWSVCADNAATDWACDETVNIDQSRGNYVQSSISPSRDGNWDQWAMMMFGGARIWMSDWEPPGLWYWFDTGSAWMHDTPAGPYNGPNEAHVRYGDRGLGLWGIWMDVPGRPRQYSSDWGNCSGGHSSRCPESRAHNFSYAGISEGTPTVTATGQDVLGKTHSASKTLKIDRSAPTALNLGGISASPGKWFKDGQYDLTLAPQDTHSGVRWQNVFTLPQGEDRPENHKARDSFQRTTVNGLGTADVGGAWQVVDGPAADFRTDQVSGEAKITKSTSDQPLVELPGTSMLDVNAKVRIRIPANSGYANGWLMMRHQPGGGWNTPHIIVGLHRLPNGKIYIAGQEHGFGWSGGRMFPDTDTGLVQSGSEPFYLRVRLTGTNPTRAQARAWRPGTPEPDSWKVDKEHTPVEPQRPGRIGFWQWDDTPDPLTIGYGDFAASTWTQKYSLDRGCTTADQCPRGPQDTSATHKWDTAQYHEGAVDFKVRAADPLGSADQEATFHSRAEHFTTRLDRTLPTVTPSSELSSTTAWFGPGRSYELKVDSADSASGVQRVEFYVDDVLEDSKEPTCNSDRCPASDQATFTWTPDGTASTRTLKVRTLDLAGNASPARIWKIRIDTVRPTAPVITGALKDAGGKAVKGTGFTLHVEAEDGTAANPSSGVKQIKLLVGPDGGALTERQASPSQTCAEGSCTQTWDTTFNLPAGDESRTPRHIRVQVVDQAGNVSDGSASHSSRVAQWRLNETSGTQARDSKGSNHGTYVGGYALGQPGGTPDGDKAVLLNGSTGRVETSYGAFAAGSARSFEGWAKRSSDSTTDALIGGDGTAAPILRTGSGAAAADVVFAPSYLAAFVTWPGALPATGSWFHWALVYDDAARQAALYINGVWKGTHSLLSGYGATPGNLQLGARNGTSVPFAGSIDDVAVYSSALSATEVAQLYRQDVYDWKVVFDNGVPMLDGPAHGQPITGWFNGSASLQATLTGHDPISGVKRFKLFTPKQGGGEDVQTHEDPNCSESITNLCPPDASKTVGYSTAGMPEGADNTVRAVVEDAVGKESGQRTWPVKVDRTPPTIDAEGSLKPADTEWVARGSQGLSLDATDDKSGVARGELRIDGQVADSADQACDGGGCELQADFSVNTDSYPEGFHDVTAIAKDTAGNSASVEWRIRLERASPSLSLAGSLKNAEGTTLDGNTTYDMTAVASDTVGAAAQSGVRSIAVTVDDDDSDVATQSCPLGGCAMTRQYSFDPSDYEAGPHTISVTATDFVGNETTEQFTVSVPDPPPVKCPDAPSPDPAINPLPTDPQAATDLFGSSSGFAPGLQAATLVTLDGETVKPGLDDSNSNAFTSTQSLSDTSADRDADDGATLTAWTDYSPICLTPRRVSIGPSPPTGPINQTAAMYANSGPASDTVFRPSPVGLDAFTQIRSGLAPKDFSWHVGLQPGEELRLLSDGSVAVVTPAAAGATPPPAGDVPPEPSAAERQQAVADTQTEIDQATNDLLRAQSLTTDQVTAVIPRPWAKDATGAPVAASVSVSGSVVTLNVTHDLVGTQFPVVASLQATSAAATNEATALVASAETADYSEQDADNFDPPDTPIPTASVSGGTVNDDGDVSRERSDAPGDQSAYSHDVGDDTDQGSPRATAAMSSPARQKLMALQLGLSESDPGNLGSVGSNGAVTKNPLLGEMNPAAYRPLVPYRVVDMLTSPIAAERQRAKLWDDWARRAQALGIKADVAIEFDKPLSKGGTAPSAAAYRAALTKFLDRYGGVVKNLSPWNEPNYRNNPLRDDPRLAARYWIAAQSVCHRKAGSVPVTARCGHLIAGEFAGTFASRERKVKWHGKNYRYTTLYHNYLTNRGKRPYVWGFHAYEDAERYSLLGDETPGIIDRYHKAYSSEGYEWKPGSKPKIWLTAIGAGYTFGCAALSDGRERLHCDGNIPEDDRDKVLRVGMAKQRSTIAFILKEIATRYTRISRVMYYNLRNTAGVSYPEFGSRASSGNCRTTPPPTDGPWCDRDDYGLVGSDQDGRFTYYRTMSGASGFSNPGDRRWAFCLFRDRARLVANVNRPSRLRKCAPPGQ